MADTVVLRSWHTQTRVAHRFGGRIVAIEVGSCVSALHYDTVYANGVGNPVEGIVSQVADCHRQRAIGMGTSGKVLQLEFGPGLTWALEIRTALACVAGTSEKLRRHRSGLGPGAADQAAKGPYEHSKPEKDSSREKREDTPGQNQSRRLCLA